MQYEVIGFGESVVDFIPIGAEDGCTIYKACPGGSVANLCVVTARMGIKTAFIGGVGNDEFGRFLNKRIAEYGVHTGGMVVTDECGTNLTFVHLKDDGERAYSAVNQPGADKMVDFSKINLKMALDCRVLHVSSNAMTCGKTREAQPILMKKAKEQGIIISYDVNYRSNYYSTENEALEVLRTPLNWADIVKVTEEELCFLTGGCAERHARQLLDGGAKIVLITKGEQGCDYLVKDKYGHVPAYKVEAIDTTGAGDCFLGGFLSWMLTYSNFDHFTCSDIRNACVWGNKTAAMSIQRIGAMSSVPIKAEVEKY